MGVYAQAVLVSFLLGWGSGSRTCAQICTTTISTMVIYRDLLDQARRSSQATALSFAPLKFFSHSLAGEEEEVQECTVLWKFPVSEYLMIQIWPAAS